MCKLRFGFLKSPMPKFSNFFCVGAVHHTAPIINLFLFVMYRPRYYSGKFDPKSDVPVQAGQALTIRQFSQLPMDKQQDLLVRGSLSGDRGVPNPSWDVPIMCRRGITLGEIQRAFVRADERIRNGISRHISDSKLRDYVQSKRVENQQTQNS